MKHLLEDLFVLELANNHWGKLERGLKIIEEFSQVVRFNNVNAAIKLQLREVNTFIHKDYRDRQDVRYIKKTLDTALSRDDYHTLAQAIKKSGCIPMATAFDEKSVDFCVELDLPILKLASSDLNDWPLIEKVAKTRRPVCVSTGGSSVKDVDDLVTFFDNRNIPLVVNHCVSIYPSEDSELDLNQIDYLKKRYPNHIIGYSTHEYTDWSSSMLISYAKGARSWERHIDINMDGVPVAPYCTLPEQADIWFKAYHKAKEMCGAPGTQKRIPPVKEIKYLDALVRGLFAKKDLPAGHVITQDNLDDDFYMAIPLLKGQLSCREIMNGEKLTQPLERDKPLMIDIVEGPYSRNQKLRESIYQRGL
ncbi:MAG: N-acetylneuraminate synthase family protein, partial [Deltaproteobacteria bacterium]|nr:N-acetylneuraminate synthase family protein [Deltaproteobacteria bacterium]